MFLCDVLLRCVSVVWAYVGLCFIVCVSVYV